MDGVNEGRRRRSKTAFYGEKFDKGKNIRGTFGGITRTRWHGKKKWYSGKDTAMRGERVGVAKGERKEKCDMRMGGRGGGEETNKKKGKGEKERKKKDKIKWRREVMREVSL